MRIWSWRENIFSILGDFVLLLGACGLDLGAAVEHFFNFRDFCSTLGGARGGF